MELNREQAIDILEKFDFFQGQRAGRELWCSKPIDVQEQDIANFSRDVALLKDYIKELTIELEAMRGAANSYKLHNEKLTEENERLRERADRHLENLKAVFDERDESNIKVNTVREFAERLDKHFCHDPAFLGVEQRLIMGVIDQTAKEMLEG